MAYRESPTAPSAGPGAPQTGYRVLSRNQFRVKASTQTIAIVIVVVPLVLWAGAHSAGAAIAVAAAIWLAGFVAVRVTRTRAQKLLNANNEASRMLTAGNVDGARPEFDKLVSATRKFPMIRALALANRGVIALRQGEPDLAVQMLGPALDSGWFDTQWKAFYPGLMCSLALALTALDDFPEAERRMHQAKARAAASQAGIFVIFDAAFALRRGQDAEGAAILTSQWAAAEAIVGARQMRLLRVLRAYALRDDPQHRGEVDRWLDGARPHLPREFHYLAVGWPKFGAFLDANGFG